MSLFFLLTFHNVQWNKYVFLLIVHSNLPFLQRSQINAQRNVSAKRRSHWEALCEIRNKMKITYWLFFSCCKAVFHKKQNYISRFCFSARVSESDGVIEKFSELFFYHISKSKRIESCGWKVKRRLLFRFNWVDFFFELWSILLIMKIFKSYLPESRGRHCDFLLKIVKTNVNYWKEMYSVFPWAWVYLKLMAALKKGLNSSLFSIDMFRILLNIYIVFKSLRAFSVETLWLVNKHKKIKSFLPFKMLESFFETRQVWKIFTQYSRFLSIQAKTLVCKFSDKWNFVWSWWN